MVAFQYRFVTTVDDLIDADAIDRARQPERMYRWLVERARELERIQLLVIGGLIALGFVIFALSSTWSDRLAIAFIGGLILLYHFVIAPRRARARIRSRNPARQTIRLEFGKGGVSMDVEGTGPVKKPWDDFTGFTESTRGVLLYFGKTTLLIPRRAFDSDDERREFVKYVKQFEPADTPL